MNHYRASVIMLIVLAMWLMNCSHQQPSIWDGGSVVDYRSLVEGLRAAGHSVEPVVEEISQPFFSVKGRRLIVDGESVQVFEYENNAAAETEAALIPPANMRILWAVTPHFYKKGKLIVLYVGDQTAITETLIALVGPQFAGR
ncbi:hypothetical protein L0337_29660 [candidate division KSB1 bacterium]|nr:hypothetical protein [candidate division KSB1 bacterium]